jgi:hypothetical protein
MRVHGQMARIVWSRRKFIDQQAAIAAMEKLNTQNTDDAQRLKNDTSYFNGFPGNRGRQISRADR